MNKPKQVIDQQMKHVIYISAVYHNATKKKKKIVYEQGIWRGQQRHTESLNPVFTQLNKHRAMMTSSDYAQVYKSATWKHVFFFSPFYFAWILTEGSHLQHKHWYH